MKHQTDKELADFILEVRRQGGRTRWRYLKTTGWRWFLLFTFVLVLLGLGTFAQAWGFTGFVAGMFAGMFGRDGTWFRQQRKIWPFYEKVLDWEKVQKIANGEPTA